MSFETFQEKFASHFSNQDFQFLTQTLEPSSLKWPRSDQIERINYEQGTLYPEVRQLGRVFGLAAPAPAPSSVLEKVLTTLKEMQKYGQVVGFSLKGGEPKVLLAVAADELRDDEILGRFVLICGVAKKFRDFALPPLGVTARGAKCPTYCHVFMAFSSHSKAVHFNEHLESKCKQYGIFSKAPRVFSWTVDLERKRVRKYSGFPPAVFKEELFEKHWFD